jgi:hypothetical protein
MTHMAIFQQLLVCMLPYILPHGLVTRKPNAGKFKYRFMVLISINKQERKRKYNAHSGALVQPLLQWKISKYRILWVCVCSRRYPACNAHAPYCHLWPARLYNIFPHYFINDTMLKKLFNTKCVFRFYIKIFFWNISHPKKNWAIYFQKYTWVFTSSTLYSCPILMKLEFTEIFSKSIRMLNFMKILPVGAGLFYGNRRTYILHNEANCRFYEIVKARNKNQAYRDIKIHKQYVTKMTVNGWKSHTLYRITIPGFIAFLKPHWNG